MLMRAAAAEPPAAAPVALPAVPVPPSLLFAT